MSYKPSNSDSFGEYQLGEGFGSAVHGDINKIDKVARLAEQGAQRLPAGLQGLNGYVSYPASLQEYPNYGESPLKATAADLAEPEDNPFLSGGYETFRGFEGFEGVEDDAFAGYSLGESMKAISQTAQTSALDEDEDEDGGFDGYGTLAGAPEESFHTYFHKASMARGSTGLIKDLARAVMTVSPNTPMSVRKQYYDLAKEMIIRRKKTDLKHLDIQRAEVESNIGWLIQPGLPQTGGFNAVLNKAVGTVGSRLAKGSPAQRKVSEEMADGLKLASELRKNNQLSGFSGLGEGSKMTYAGLAVAGIAIAGLIYYLCKAKPAAPLRKKRKSRKSRKRK